MKSDICPCRCQEAADLRKERDAAFDDRVRLEQMLIGVRACADAQKSLVNDVLRMTERSRMNDREVIQELWETLWSVVHAVNFTGPVRDSAMETLNRTKSAWKTGRVGDGDEAKPDLNRNTNGGTGG